MNYEGLTKQVVELIDGYKIDKVNKLLNGNSQSKKPLEKEGVKGGVQSLLSKSAQGKLTDESKKILDKVINILHNYDIELIYKQLLTLMLDNDRLFFVKDGIDNDPTDQWKNDIGIFKKRWKEKKEKEDCKSPLLKKAIKADIKKSLKELDGFDNKDVQRNVDRKIEHAIESGKLNYPLDRVLQGLKKTSQNIGGFIGNNEDGWKEKLKSINEKHIYTNWISQASSQASRLTFSTHVAKLTHTEIKASDISFSGKGCRNLLTTASIKDKSFDISGNAAFTPTKNFLNLECKGSTVFQKIQKGDTSFLQPFFDSEIKLNDCMEGLKKAFQPRALLTNHIAKQIFWPVSGKYHLINPMVSSSLDQAIYQRIESIRRFNEDVQEVKKHKDENLYFDKISIKYPKLAALKVTATPKAHPNASPLNQDRKGRRYVFSSSPPVWKKIIKRPINQESLFSGEFDHLTWRDIKGFQKYLLNIKNKKSNKIIRDQVKIYVNKIIESLFTYVNKIQEMESMMGWTLTADRLKEAHKLWLDPYRSDSEFQQKRRNGDWQNEVCKDFGKWMNRKLETNEMEFFKFEAGQWARLLKGRLKEFERGLEVKR